MRWGADFLSLPPRTVQAATDQPPQGSDTPSVCLSVCIAVSGVLSSFMRHLARVALAYRKPIVLRCIKRVDK